MPYPFDQTWFRFLIGFVLGGCIGSFATMLTYRLPRRLSIVAPRSHCPACGHTLGARDLVPLLSYLWQRGRCHYCNACIGQRYLLIELAFALAGGFITLALFSA
jgi:leader peptidase (prepilin peptidase)/N-methyltransferase